MENLACEIVQKHILHWNCREFGELPIELNEGNTVQEIYLKWNKLLFLPSWIGNLTSLTNLYLQHNQLKCLPEELSELTQLNVLDVTNNRLQALPAGIGQLSSLTHFLAADNVLSWIPQEFQMLQSLQILNLSNNHLTQIPEPILECRALQEIIFDNNHLTRLPENIVYLPHLETLSVCGNQLLYLPFLPFSSNPYLRFENNSNLMYISMWLGQQISSQNNGKIDEDSPWNLLGADGCFCTEQVSLHLHAGDIVVRKDKSEIGVPLTLPPCLQHVSSGPNCEPTVPPLLELTMRRVYSLSYHHTIMSTECEEQLVFAMKRTVSHNQFHLCLPLLLQRQLQVGPVTMCYFCKRPIFMYGVIWVILKECFIDNGFGPQMVYVLVTVVFCSASCSSSYTCSERLSTIQNKLEARKLNWFHKRLTKTV